MNMSLQLTQSPTSQPPRQVTPKEDHSQSTDGSVHRTHLKANVHTFLPLPKNPLRLETTFPRVAMRPVASPEFRLLSKLRRMRAMRNDDDDGEDESLSFAMKKMNEATSGF